MQSNLGNRHHLHPNENDFARMESAFQGFMRESIRIEAALGPFAMLAISLIRLGLTLMIELFRKSRDN